ncbi:MAG: gliding motility-associated C-terminal domain-containing protein [Bacteroidales bacterium]
MAFTQKNISTCMYWLLFVLLLFVLSGGTPVAAQNHPSCDLIYFIKENRIYALNPQEPASDNNPTYTGLDVPFNNRGFCISEIIKGDDTISTYYVINTENEHAHVFSYYDGDTWITTDHMSGTEDATNIGSGGGYIYNLSAESGTVYRYDGTGDAEIIAVVDDFNRNGPFDLIGDCLGNWYILTTEHDLYLRKYNSSGKLLQEWTYENPNRWNGRAGFGVIGNDLYFDDPRGVVHAVLSKDTLILADITEYKNVVYVRDFATCGQSIYVYPDVEISISQSYICLDDSLTFVCSSDAPGPFPEYTWYVNSQLVAEGDSVYTYVPEEYDTIWCEHRSSAVGVLSEDIVSDKIVIEYEDESIPAFSVEPIEELDCVLSDVAFSVNTEADMSDVIFDWYLNNELLPSDSSAIDFSALQAEDIVTCEMTVDFVCTPEPLVVRDSIQVFGPVTTRIDTTFCKGEYVFFNESEIYKEGVYRDTFCTSHMCDSIVELHVSVENPPVDSLSVVLCASDSVEINGVQYTKAGEFVQRIPKPGCVCDSLLIITVEQEERRDTIIHDGFCKGEVFVYNNREYNTAGVFLDTVLKPDCCPQYAILELEEYDTSYTHVSVDICAGESYDFFGNSYNNAGTYTYVETNQYGCDSTIALSVSVDDTDVTEIDTAICWGASYDFNGRIIQQTGTYSETFTNSYGCDSLVVLNLYVRNRAERVIDTIVCEGDVYDFYGRNIKSEGEYSHILTDEYACDSIVTLHISFIQQTTNYTDTTICRGDSVEINGEYVTDEGDYVVKHVDDYNCGYSEIIQVRFFNESDFVSCIGPATVCENTVHEYTFFKTHSNVSNLWYRKASEEKKYSICKSSCIDSIKWESSGLDTVYIYGEYCNGCVSRLSYPVEVVKYPQASFQLEPKINQHVIVTNTSEKNSVLRTQKEEKVRYNWKFYPFCDTMIENNQYSFEQQVSYGENSITLRAENQFGCVSYFYDTINIEASCRLYIPDAFAPTHISKKVRTFKPYGVQVQEFEMYVFDSWGNIVWYTEGVTSTGSPLGEWDGKYKGEILQQGTYFWKVRAVFADGSTYGKGGNEHGFQYGTVDIIR